MTRIHISTKQWPLAHTEAQGLAEGRLRDGRQEPAALRLLLGLQRHRIARGTALQEVGKSGEEGLQRTLSIAHFGGFVELSLAAAVRHAT